MPDNLRFLLPNPEFGIPGRMDETNRAATYLIEIKLANANRIDPYPSRRICVPHESQSIRKILSDMKVDAITLDSYCE